MDIATIIGVVCGFLCVFITITLGGSIAVFIHIPSVLITVGGMLSATLIHFSLGQVLKIIPVAKKTLFYKLPSEQEIIQEMVNYSAVARRDGPLALEQQMAGINDPFLTKALQLIIDGQKEEDIEESLLTEIQSLQERHEDGKKILAFMGSSAPAFGMIGTLIGLVMMLQNLSDPSQIGAGMAVALITTFYGALLANLIFIPLAGKLGIRSKQEAQIRTMIVEAVTGIARAESPTAIRERMQAFVSAKNREKLKPSLDGGQTQAA